MDADLSAATNDKFTISTLTDGSKVAIGGLNLTSDSAGSSSTITVATKPLELDLLYNKIFTTNKLYEMSSPQAGQIQLDVMQSGYKTLDLAYHTAGPIRYYRLSGDETIYSNGDMGAGNLTIDGDGHSITGEEDTISLSAAAGDNLNLQNIGAYSKTLADASTSGAILFSDGNYYTVNIENKGLNGFKFTSNNPADQVLYNNKSGTINLLNTVISGNSNKTTTSNYSVNGCAVYSAGNMTISGTIFDSNTADSYYYTYGGAISNAKDAVMKISDSIFTKNSATMSSSSGYGAMGGAIYNLGELVVNNSVFAQNTASSSSSSTAGNADVFGGAIYNYGGSLTVLNSVFQNNNATASVASVYGGAIASSGGSLIISNSIFAGNTSKVTGGAIRINNGDVTISGSTFEENKAGSYGGAIASGGNLTISDSIFKNNSNISSSAYTADGGALYISGKALISNTIFSGNYVSTSSSTDESSARGGAIYNSNGTITIIDSSFVNNYVSSDYGYGGAIYNNGGTISIVARDKDVVFDGNYEKYWESEDKTSQAIYIPSGTLNLNAGSNDIIINDVIYSSRGTININLAGTSTNDSTPNGNFIPQWAGTTGRVVINNEMTMFNSTVMNIYGGTVKVGAAHTDSLGNSVNPTVSAGTINLYGGTLDLANGSTDSLSGLCNIYGDTNIMIDVDRANAYLDSFTNKTSITPTGTLKITAINIISDKNSAESLNFKLNSFDVLNTVTYTNKYKYNISKDSNYLKFTSSSVSDSFSKALADTSEYKTFSLTDNYVANNYTTINKGTNFFIYGNGYSLSGGANHAFTIQAGQNLNISRVGKFTLTEVAEGTTGAIPKFYADGTIKYYTLTIDNPGMNGFGVVASVASNASLIYSSGVINIDNSVISNNNNESSYSVNGSAIYANPAASTIITDSIFSGNNVNSTDSQSYGGAIYSTSGSNLTISNSIFTGNQATADNAAHGGAIYSYGNVNIKNSVFIDNNAESANSYAYGGALYSNGFTTIKNTVFKNNTAGSGGSSAYIYGGAISGESTNLMILTNSVFDANSAFGTATNTNGVYGGAIFKDSGQLVLIDSVFTNNSAISKSFRANGGAIGIHGTYGATLGLIAKDKDVLFEGNYISTDGGTTKVSNAVYVQSTTFNLNAGEHNIIFNDRITGNYGTLNINQTGTWDDTTNPSTPDGNFIPTWAPTTGTIELNEDMSGYAPNIVNFYGGTLKLGEDRTNTYSQAVTPKFFKARDLNFYGGTLNLQNQKIDDITITNLTGSVDSEGNALGNLKIDANLSTGAADNFTISGTAAGKLNISGINILADGSAGSITVFKNEISPELEVLTTYTNKMKYIFTPSSTAGVLTVGSGDSASNMYFGLASALADTDALRSFSVTDDYTAATNLGTMQGENSTLVIFGNRKNINGDSHSGMTVKPGQTVNIRDVGAFSTVELTDSTAGVYEKYYADGSVKYYNTTLTQKGLNGFVNLASGDSGTVLGSAIYNSGTITIQDSVISENNLTTSEEINLSGGAIYNNGTMNVDGTFFYMNAINATTMAANGGAIYNDGSMAVNDSIFYANSSVSERHARGGAIRNNSGTQYITNSSFAYNYANSTSLTESNTTALGGALYNGANLYIENTAFYKNHTNGFTAHGGAIQNAGNLTIVSSIFDGNYSEGGT